MKMQKNLAKNLRAKLQDDEQLVSDLVKCTKISKSAVGSYLRGDGNPRLDTLEQICETLKITPDQLLLHDSADRAQDDQVQLAQVMATISGASEFPIEEQIALFELYLQMAQIYKRNKTPRYGDISHETVEMTGKMEALV